MKIVNNHCTIALKDGRLFRDQELASRRLGGGT